MHNKRMQTAIDNSITAEKFTSTAGTLGVITSYDQFTNTATVAITKQQTDEIEQIITKVMCPRQLGVQTVAPQPGVQCWVAFKGGNITQPLITQYYNHRYDQYDYSKQTRAHSTIPSYLLGL